MRQGSRSRVAIISLVLLTILFYGYYNYLSYQVYRTMKSLNRRDNPVAVEVCSTVLKSKYRYSIYFFMIDE
jgi:hypothetical protein